ncbi:MAG: HEAT repeat domain-containing protein [Planctomycetota bacterium]|nr:HEAT repeat domain-containing protein [Planctomycetota bacterium]
MSDAQMQSLIEYVLEVESRPRDSNPLELQWLGEATDVQLDAFLRTLLDVELTSDHEPALGEVFRYLVYRLRPWDASHRRRLAATTVPLIVALYRRLGKANAARCYLLQLLAASAIPFELTEFANLVVEDPPGDAPSALLAFGPLFQHTSYDSTMLFPKLLDALAHQVIAASVIDLANFLFRHGLIDPHPGVTRQEQLTELLGAVVGRLARMEEDPTEFATTPDEIARQIEDAIALAVALCDALALIGDRDAVGKLYQALEVRHRRLHTEAAAALARFGEEAGKDALVALAAEPVARLRVLAYAEELGLTDKLDEQFTTPAARAEAELALWLAQPSQMGLPPTWLELVDSRTQHWPGYDEPMESFLIRFTYQLPAGEFSNVGIAGPLTHAFGADLLDLPPDDIYAAFAGWHVEHEDIFEMDAAALTEAQRLEVTRLERRLRDFDYDAVQPTILGMFLGDKVLVARAVRQGHAGIAVVDDQEPIWFPTRNPARPIGSHEACCIYKGRRLLRAFN